MNKSTTTIKRRNRSRTRSRSRSRSRSKKTIEKKRERSDNQTNKNKKVITERKIIKARRRTSPVFLPNDPYAFNARKRNYEGSTERTDRKKMELEDSLKSNQEALFEQNMPIVYKSPPASAEDETDEIIKKMMQVYLG